MGIITHRFRDKKSQNSQRRSGLPHVTWLMCGKAQIQTHILQTDCSDYDYVFLVISSQLDPCKNGKEFLALL